MRQTFFKSKIHRARVTHADLDYEGSITIDDALMEAGMPTRAHAAERGDVAVAACQGGLEVRAITSAGLETPSARRDDAMGLCERLVDASCAAMNAARSGNVAEAYRFALTMISIAYEIELHAEIAPGLAAVEQVVWTERSYSWQRPRGVMEDQAAARNR